MTGISPERRLREIEHSGVKEQADLLRPSRLRRPETIPSACFNFFTYRGNQPVSAPVSPHAFVDWVFDDAKQMLSEVAAREAEAAAKVVPFVSPQPS